MKTAQQYQTQFNYYFRRYYFIQVHFPVVVIDMCLHETNIFINIFYFFCKHLFTI